MPHPDRRSFLAGLGTGALAAAPCSRVFQDPVAVGDLQELAEIVRRTPRDQIIAKARQLAGLGASWRDLLGAAFLAGVRDVEPRPVGFQFHCVLMTASAYQIAEALPASERLLPALFNLSDYKASQAIDAEDPDWTLGPPPATEVDGVQAARDLQAALAAWDVDAAARAATALARGAGLDEAFAALWPFAARDFTNIGHNPIFVAQAHRTLQQVGWRFGEEVLRSLVHGLLDGAPGAADASFAPNRERTGKLRPDWRQGKPSAQGGGELLAALRTADPGGAADALVALLNGGLALPSACDAMRLFAVEQLWRAPGILAVHALTAFNALRYGSEHCRDDATARLLVLQAASWLVQYRDFLARANYDDKRPGLETLVRAEAKATAAEVFAAAGSDPVAAAAPCLSAAADGGGLAALGGELRHWLVRKAREHHDYKFAAALLEEVRLADADVGARMLAGSLAYLHKPADADGATWQKAQG